ncbi:MAG: ABC transporter substrate-binding protein [Coprococcus sp.]
MQEKRSSLAINADEIIDTAYGSDELATVANSLLTPDQSLYNKDCKGYEQDLEEAKKLAKSSGIEGTTLKYVYNADRPNMEEVATVLQQQLAEIGVTLDVEGLDSNAFFQRFFAIMFQSGKKISGILVQMDGILSVEAVLDRLTATSTAAPKHGDSVMKPDSLQQR